jgi:hypothetical protein
VRVRKPEGQGLNDLYVRFFRMAERRIVDKTGRGIVCFISNYSWLDGLSFTGMRERYLDAFDVIRIDCLNGDKFKTGKTTPDGKSDPSIFSTEHNREGIQVGTAIVTLVRKPEHGPSSAVGFRHLWGTSKRQDLLTSAENEPAALYTVQEPPLELGLPFVAAQMGAGYSRWPKILELLPVSFPGVKTSRDDFLVAIDRETLECRLRDYFDPAISDSELRALHPSVMEPSARFDPVLTRQLLVKRHAIAANVVRYAYRPFDVRWLYWEPETKLLDEKRSEYWPHVVPTNSFIEAREKEPKEEFSRGTIVGGLADNFGNGLSTFYPLGLSDGGRHLSRVNVSQSLVGFLDDRKLPPETVFHHVAAILHTPTYRTENAGALRMDWPHLPLPSEAGTLRSSAALGAALATLLNTETPVPGVSNGALRIGLKSFALPTRRNGKSLSDDDLKVSARWGSIQNSGGGRIVMPGPGLAAPRAYTDAERTALALEGKTLGLSLDDVLALLGETTFDIHMNANACWSNVPARVWDYTLGGYQVIKKWLSYREYAVLGRALKPDEAVYVSEMVRRIAAILVMGPVLDANYADCKAAAVSWKDGAPAA